MQCKDNYQFDAVVRTLSVTGLVAQDSGLTTGLTTGLAPGGYNLAKTELNNNT